jgi:hypothetical protein
MDALLCDRRETRGLVMKWMSVMDGRDHRKARGARTRCRDQRAPHLPMVAAPRQAVVRRLRRRRVRVRTV